MKRKHLFLMASIALLLASCQNQLETKDDFAALEIIPTYPSRYVPKGVCQTIELANGNVIYMDCDSTYFLADIIFSKEQVEAMNQPATKAAAIKSYVKYWPNKVIPYYIVNKGFSSYQRSIIERALTTLESAAQIDFQQTSSTTSPCLMFYPSLVAGSSSSQVGKQNNGNTIYLDTTVMGTSTVMHEVMHSLGFFHEHMRTDRDDYVIIHEENIDPRYTEDFQLFTEYDGGSLGYNIGEFDYNSIMIYSSAMGATSQGYAMTKLDGSPIYQGTRLSNKDIAGLNFIYGPKPVLTVTLDNCENNGDFSSIDERSTYSNIITFLDRNNQQVALTYDRLVVVEYHYTSQTGPDYYNQTSWSETEYHVVPAGSIQYDLGNTVRIRQEDMGINRFWQDEWYSVHVY